MKKELFFNLERIRENARQAETEDLLDRITVFQPEMEPEAVGAIEEELRVRGLTTADINHHARQREATGFLKVRDLPVRCSFCFRPALGWHWSWHRFWGMIPLFPRRYYFCGLHQANRDP
jgi:hypothetical protein